MKAKLIVAIIGTVLSGVICLGLSVVSATMAISATSIGMALWYGLLSLLEIGAVVNTAVQVTKVVKKWF